MTGESISVSRVAGANSIAWADSWAHGRAEAKIQPAGSCNSAATFAALAARPLGYSNTVFQLTTTRFALEEAAWVNPFGSDGNRKSRVTSTESAPAGTSS